MPNTFYDVIIVGGGPAGTTAGAYLARQGVAVALLDKAAFPRRKPCGGGLTYRILERFPDIAPQIEACVVNRAPTIRFYAPDLTWLAHTSDEPITLMIRRREFDAMLLEQYRRAGGAVVAPARVVDVKIADTHVEVVAASGEILRGTVVIGADGAQSLIARRSGLRANWPRRHLMLSVVADIPAACLAGRDQSVVHTVFGLRGFGYGWLFPKHETLNIGVAGLLTSNPVHRMQTVFREFVTVLQQQGILTPSVPAPRLRGGLIPIHGPTPPTYRERLLLCGDAAGFVHGVTGEGIYYAMISGVLAARTVLCAFERRDFSAAVMGAYERLWQHDIGRELAESVHLQQRLIQAPYLVGTVVRTAGAHVAMQQAFANYFLGKTPYRELKRSLMRHFLPQYLKLRALNAWRAVICAREFGML